MREQSGTHLSTHGLARHWKAFVKLNMRMSGKFNRFVSTRLNSHRIHKSYEVFWRLVVRSEQRGATSTAGLGAPKLWARRIGRQAFISEIVTGARMRAGVIHFTLFNDHPLDVIIICTYSGYIRYIYLYDTIRLKRI